MLTAMTGGIIVLVAELLGSTVLAVVGAALFLGGIATASVAVVAHARTTGTPLLSATWEGIRSAAALVRLLAP